MSGSFTPANFTFGNSIANERMQKERINAQLAQSAQQAAMQARGQNMQRDQAEAQRAEQARQFDAKLISEESARQDAIDLKNSELDNKRTEQEEHARQFDENLIRKDREYEDKRKRLERLDKWEDIIKEQQIRLNEQEALEKEQKFANLRKQSEAYDLAYEKDQIALQELQDQHQRRSSLLNDEIGLAVLAAFKNGGNMTPGQLQIFNSRLQEIDPSTNYDFIGNTMSFKDANGKTVVKQIGDGKGMYMGSYQKTKNGDIIYGDDGTPMTTMQQIPNGLVQTILNSAYGKSYLEIQKQAGRKELKQMEIDAKKDRQDAWLDSKEKIAENNGGKVKYDQKLYESLENDLNRMKYETDENGDIDPTKPKKLTDEEKADIEAREKHLRDMRWGAIGYGQQEETSQVQPTKNELRQLLAKKRAEESQVNNTRPYRTISNQSYAQLSDDDKKKCQQIPGGQGWKMYLDNGEQKEPEQVEDKGTDKVEQPNTNSQATEMNNGDDLFEGTEYANSGDKTAETQEPTKKEEDSNADLFEKTPKTEKDKAWEKYWIEHGSKGVDKKMIYKRFEKWWNDEQDRKYRISRLGKSKVEPNFLSSGR